jgi:hypothetical protein
MTYGVARAATSPELTLYRTEKKSSKWRAALFTPHTVYTARINQVFTSYDGVLEITYDGGSGTLANVLADMTMLVGSSAGAHDKGIVRLRGADATKFYIGETSDIAWADNLYLTVIDHFGLWARHVLINAGIPYMDGGVAYSDQHDKPDPVPIMGSNRALKLTGSTVSTQFDGSASYVVGGLSSISSYAWSCATSSSSSGTTTATPTFTFNTVGFHLVYLVVTAANGKSFFGVRYVYVWNDANPPVSMQISDPRQDVESGGWEFEIMAVEGVDLATVPDHTLVILFAEDQFGGTQSNIGPVAGSENVEITGWLAREENSDNPEKPTTTFTVYTAHYWLAQIAAFPDGVEFTTGAPSAWTQFQNLTVDKGLWHFLHWRTTATRVMDVFLIGDTKYTAEVSSLASTLWEQIREMAFLQIYARPGVNAWNQLFIQVHPQLVPAAGRTWPTVMTITKGDWRGEISFERITMTPCAVVSLSGVAVNASGVGSSFFSLSPGHAYPHFGSVDVQDRLLVSDQAQANQLAGLYRGWRNNPYPEIPISLVADIRLIDCFPRSKCAIVISSGDTPRGISYSGNLLPIAVSIVTDPETGRRYREVTFEAETFEDISTNGDVPGSRADTSTAPPPRFPPLPDFPVILPGLPDLSPDGAQSVILFAENTSGDEYGLAFTENFDDSGPHWALVNAGLSQGQINAIDKVCLTPSGGIYVAFRGLGGFIAYASSIGGTFTIVEDATTIQAKFPAYTNGVRVVAIGVNPLNGQCAYCITASDSFGGYVAQVYIGSGTSFSAGASPNINGGQGDLTYGFGNWRLTAALGSTSRFIALSSTAGSVVRDVSLGTSNPMGQVPISTTDSVYVFKAATGGILKISGNGANGGDFSTVYGSLLTELNPWENHADCDPTGQYLMAPWDTGKRGKSSDYGPTWAGLPGLPFANPWHFANAGDGSRWAAGGGGMVRWSPDAGTSWFNREGDIASVAPLLNVRFIKVVTR